MTQEKTAYYFQAELKCFLEISDEEFNFLWACCERHYDFKVQSLVEIGGFLYGFKNRREFSKGEDKIMDLSFRQIDLLLKSLIYHTQLEIVLNKKLFSIIKEMDALQGEINKKLLQNV